jgi:hypothetical protein
VSKYHSRSAAIIAVAFLLICLGPARSVWAGEGGQGASCKTSDDCATPFQCQSIEGKTVCAFASMPDRPGTPPQPNFKRCHIDADCDPGWTCGGRAGQVLPSGGDCVIVGSDCFTQADCPPPLVCYMGPNPTGRGECTDARFIPKSQP